MERNNNVADFSEYHKARLLKQLEETRNLGGVAVFNAENENGKLADIIYIDEIKPHPGNPSGGGAA